ncbi:hypothetical protein BH09BAC1_BH09BAC1_06010 [soil metagenome]
MNDTSVPYRFSGMIMQNKAWLALVGLLFMLSTLVAQTVTDATGHLLYTLQDGVIYDAQSKPLITAKGNLLFKGASESKDDIVLLIGTENVFSDKSANAIGSDLQTTRFVMGKGGFYLPGYGLSDGYIIAKYTLGSKGDLVLLAGQPAVILANVKGDNWTTGELTAIFYLLNEQYQLKELLTANVGAGNLPNNQPKTGNVATLRRMWNTGEDDFSWDGRILKRRWNSSDFEEWEFDGRYLHRVWYDDGVDYEWDGKILKRRFNAGTEEFEWDGRVLRRRWNTGNDEFTMQGNVVKRMWDTGNDEWEMTGEMPIPVIAMIVFGLIRK